MDLRRRVGIALLALWCTAASMAGCAKRPVLAPAPESVTEPEREPKPAPRLDALLAERNRAFESLRSLAKVHYRTGDRKGSFDAAVLLRRPNRFRLEVFSFVGAALILTVDEGEFTGLLPSQGRYYRERTSPRNLFRATQLLLDLDEIVALLMGLPPMQPSPPWLPDGRSLRRVRADGSTETVVFDEPATTPVRWHRTSPSGSVWYAATFEDFTDTAFGPFPLQITLETPPLKRFYQIRYDNPELNVTLPDPHFVQELPEGVVRSPLPAPGG